MHKQLDAITEKNHRHQSLFYQWQQYLQKYNTPNLGLIYIRLNGC